MATTRETKEAVFTAFHLFAGIGGGALGAARARSYYAGLRGRIENIGAVDVDPLACQDYRAITGDPITCMDLFSAEQYEAFHGERPPLGWREATAADVLKAAGGRCPDVVFSSPPCKGLSSLLPAEKAASPKYQALNRLVVRGVRLTLDAFAHDLPAVFLLENVPRILSRGADLVREVKDLLASRGYRVHDAAHDCGEIGGLGQRRRRYLLIARNPRKVRPFIYKPRTYALKTIGDVLGELPLPDDPGSGPMHRLPRLKFMTWLRLALIPAGGDWRDLKNVDPDKVLLSWEPRGGGPFGVQPWEEPGATVIGRACVRGSNAAAVADPRFPENDGRHVSHFRVTPFGEPSVTVTGSTHVANGAICAADPRIPDPRMTGGPAGFKGSPGLYGIARWDGQMPAVTGSVSATSSNCPAAVDDPRLGALPFAAVGKAAVALKENPNRHSNILHVQPMDRPSTCVTGTRFGSGAHAVSDVRIGHSPRQGSYRILRMDEPSPTVVGSACVGKSNGPQAVADHRIPRPDETPEPPPVIVSEDGTWHRPLTTLELAALQSFPVRLPDGSPLVLAGRSDAAWRERIGNAVPPEASRGVHETILLALLQETVGMTMILNDRKVWVRTPATEDPRLRGSAAGTPRPGRAPVDLSVKAR